MRFEVFYFLFGLRFCVYFFGVGWERGGRGYGLLCDVELLRIGGVVLRVLELSVND